jgi:MFS family permease
LLEVFKRRNFWLLLIVAMPMVGTYVACLQNLAPLLASRGFDQRVAGVLVPMFSISHLAANLIAGLLSDRFGNRPPLVGLATVTTVGCFFIAIGASLPMIGLGAVLIGLSGGVWPLLASATAVEFGSSGFGRAFGLLSLFLPIAVATTYFVAKMQENTGSYVPPLSGLATAALLGGAICLTMRERREQMESPSESVAVGPVG